MSKSITEKKVVNRWKFPCPLCDIVTGFRNSIRRHVARKHPGVDIGPGERGYRTAGGVKNLSVDGETEENFKVYGCAICLGQFWYRYQLKHHYEYDHGLVAANVAEVDCLLREHNIQFALFEDSQKWKLKSGRNVEDILHDFALAASNEHSAHSFIINPVDSTWLQLDVFSKDELDEISTLRYNHLPALPRDLMEYINEFNLTDQQQIRETLWKQRPFDASYDQKESFDKDWARNVIHSILMEIECRQLSQDHLESWYISHIWSTLDRCFGDLDEVYVIRGESASIASGIRKNENRIAASTTSMKRQMMGHRADLLIRKLKVEYACGETGKSYNSENDTKLLLERQLKMPKMMKDQLIQLFKLCDNDESAVRKLSIAGILHFGLHQTMLLMDCPAGYVCRVLPTPTCKVPTTLNTFPSLLNVIKLTWKAKALIRQVIKDVERYNSSNDGDSTEIDVITSRYRTPPLSHGCKDKLYIPSCVTSPTKKQKM
ncbi:hypothetical protein K450DRAFT_256424 [Umbelopsis ramanniana AG]|uniref:C2H2-type domain-containing protein n=1 Tax=Umbelopsis ramanniana AG TaxID=1314678 RepID=A0AAD5E4A7_UMBRA|nr:uncharacterized protein K450DRAFT_256424 [Umbelopsis ramanniana AG]KAI8576492.1 hypothetical protein K450DRAFT_256424 [Umbelopsis ramanniana AG]